MSDKAQSHLKPDRNSANAIDNDLVDWSCHPVKRRPLFSTTITLFVLLLIALVYNTTQSVFFGLLAFVIMFVSLAKFYFPTKYLLDEKGVTVKTTTHTLHKNWSDFRSAYPDKNGVLLSPFAEPSRLENFRGLYIMFNNNGAEVTAFVNSHVVKADCESAPKEIN